MQDFFTNAVNNAIAFRIGRSLADGILEVNYQPLRLIKSITPATLITYVVDSLSVKIFENWTVPVEPFWKVIGQEYEGGRCQI